MSGCSRRRARDGYGASVMVYPSPAADRIAADPEQWMYWLERALAGGLDVPSTRALITQITGRYTSLQRLSQIGFARQYGDGNPTTTRLTDVAQLASWFRRRCAHEAADALEAGHALLLLAAPAV